MATPIEGSPTLKGKEAIRFLKQVLEEQRNPSPARIKFLREARSKRFVVHRANGDQYIV